MSSVITIYGRLPLVLLFPLLKCEMFKYHTLDINFSVWSFQCWNPSTFEIHFANKFFFQMTWTFLKGFENSETKLYKGKLHSFYWKLGYKRNGDIEKIRSAWKSNYLKCTLQVAIAKAVSTCKTKIYLILFDLAYPVAAKTQPKSGMLGICMARSTCNLKMSLFFEDEV